jgi:hypothetical protein
MSKLSFGPFQLGMDNVSPEGVIPAGGVLDAVNLDFDRVGGFNRRTGRSLLLAGVIHSLWTSLGGETFAVHNKSVSIVTRDSTRALFALTQDGPVSYDDLLDGVVFSGARDLCFVAPGGSVRTLGVENPGGVTVAAETYGGLLAGRYAVAVAFLRGTEESGLSTGAFVAVPFGGGLRIAVPQPTDAAVTGIRVYRTEANGDVFYRVADIPKGLPSYLLGTTDVGRQADNQFLERLDPGQIVRYWNGRVLVARGSTLLYSQPMRYGLFDRRHDFAQFPHRITLMQPVEGGVFVGTKAGVSFLAGGEPAAWVVKPTGGQPPIAGTGTSVDADQLGGDARGRLALWVARNGFVLGTPDGAILEPQKDRIRIPPEQWNGTGAVCINGRKVVASIG